MSVKQQNTWPFQNPISSPCSLYCVPQTLWTHWQSFQSLIFPSNSLSTFNNFWATIYPPTNVSSDGDLFLFLTFCQNVWLVLSACSAGASPFALCILTSLRHCGSEYLKFVFVLTMYMPPVLGLLQFIHSQKAAFAMWCFHLTTEFQRGILSSPAFFLPVVLMVEEVAASRELVSSAHKFFLFRMFFICTIKISTVYSLWPLWVIATDQVSF